MVLLNSSSCNFNWKPVNFEFTSLQGDKSSIYESKGINGLLVLFICNHCPYVKPEASDKSSKEIYILGLEKK